MTDRAVKTVKTTCAYCGVGCGVIAAVDETGAVSIKGDPDHPANFGRLCSKGTNLGETLGLGGRLLNPEMYGRQTGWDEALDHIAKTFRKTVRAHGPDSVALYASGQLLTEDYYVANKLMKGFIGSANIDTNSRLCMASTVAGHKRAFGSDTVPGCYEDLELCDLLVVVGSNTAWCHPVLFQRIKAAKEKRPDMKVVLIDPRRTATAEIADMHLAIKSEGDTALFNGLLSYLSETGRIDPGFIVKSTTGFRKALIAAGRLDLDRLALNTGLERQQIAAFFALFASAEKTVTLFSQGVNQSVRGTDKVSAILNCHLATGRIGKPGMGPFSVTGQPNAMGGREVGGLANQLAAHMELENPQHRALVQEFWQSPVIAHKPGLKAVDLFKAVADGKIKALWILATNPVDSLPEADLVQSALETCDFVVASDILNTTDTLRHAHIKLPSAGWGEKKGTVTNSERRISLQKPFLPMPGNARPDWWQLAEVGKRMGYGAAFDYAAPADIFREHAALSGYKNAGTRDFDISDLSELSGAQYETLSPVQWPVVNGKSAARLFEDGRFFSNTGKASFIAVDAAAPAIPAIPAISAPGPFLLNTGRVRDHWHTMTRTGTSAKLSLHMAEPFVEVHPLDAKRLGLEKAGLATVENSLGKVDLRVVITDRIRPSTVFVPMHWTDQYTSLGRVNSLVPAHVDPVSGQPGFKHTAVSLSKSKMRSYGFAIGDKDPGQPTADYWAKAKCRAGWQVELAYHGSDLNWRQIAFDLWQVEDTEGSEILCYQDVEAGTTRLAAFDGNRLIGALFIGPGPVEVSRNWAQNLLDRSFDQTLDKTRVLAGRPDGSMPEKGPIICSCFEVGSQQIIRQIKDGCHTVDIIGRELSAGTNCGSCRSEIQSLLDLQLLAPVAAE